MVKRSVKYESPGHTVVKYPYRTLHIHFKESKKEFDARAKARRKAAARKSGLARKGTHREYYEENGIVYTKTGRVAKDQTVLRRDADRYKDEKIKRDLQHDMFTIEDMRALLKDEHWEEYCGHKRWMRDDKACVMAFNSYVALHRGMQKTF